MANWNDTSSTWNDTTATWDSGAAPPASFWDASPVDWDDATPDWDNAGGIQSLSAKGGSSSRAKASLSVALRLAGKAATSNKAKGNIIPPGSTLWDVPPTYWDTTPVNWDSATAPGAPSVVTPPPTDPEVVFPEPSPDTTSPVVYTTPVPPAFIQDLIFGPVVQRRRRCDIYQSNGETLWMRDAPLIGGNVSVDMSRAERRMADVTFDNEGRKLDHFPGGFWYDKVLKLYHGVETPTAIWETQIGEFMIDDIKESDFPHDIAVKARDYAKKLMRDKLPAAVTFPKSRPVAQIVRTLATNGGITKFNLNDDGQVLGIDASFERNVTRWEAIQKLADAHSLEVFFDRFGFLILRPYRDPLVAPVSFTFLTGEVGNLADYDKASNDAELYNHVVVTGAATANRIPVFGEAENTNPASPTSVGRLGGRRTLPVDDPLVASTQQAVRRAEQLLRVAALQSYEINLSAILAPWLDVGEAVEFIDPRAVSGQPTRFLLTGLEFPLALGPMTARARRLSIVTSTGGEPPSQPPPVDPPPVDPPPPTTTAPSVTVHPVALLTVAEGQNFTFTAQATGNPTPTIQWQYSTSTSGPWTNITGVTSNTLTEQATVAKDNNFYRAVFTSTAGTAATTPGRLDVTPAPSGIAVGNPRLAWYYFDYNNPPSDAVINAWAPQLALVVLHPRMTATRDKIRAVNPSARILASKSLWSVVQTETSAPYSTALSYSQAQQNQWLAQATGTGTPTDTFPMTKQAETFTLVNPSPNGMTNAVATRAGYRGTGYISSWYQEGERVSFTYTSTVARNAALKFRHAQANASQTATRTVMVNGVSRGSVTFPSTGANYSVATWVADVSRPYINVPLVQGINTIELVVPAGGDGIELDEVTIDTEVTVVTPPPVTPGTGTGKWEIDSSGNFIDPFGRRTQLVGANAGIQNYILVQNNSNGQLSLPNGVDFDNWGWNFCRLVTLPDFAAGGAGSPGPVTLQQLVDKIIALHNDFAAREIVLMVCSFESGVGTNPAPGATPNTDEMIRRLIDAIGDSPWLWINYQNEPYWDGGTGWINYHNYGYNLVRSRPKGANTMFVADCYQSGQAGAGNIGDFNTFRSGKHHVVLSYHAYMAGKTAATLEGERTSLNNANIAWMIGEYAYQPNNPGAACCGGTYDNQRAGALKIINEWIPAGESAAWWIATADNDSHTLRTPGSGYNDYARSLNEAGNALWNKRTQSRQY